MTLFTGAAVIVNGTTVGSPLGGRADDTSLWTSALTASGNQIDLGAGTDTLTLTAGPSSVNDGNTELMPGSGAADRVVLATALTASGDQIHVGAGNDTRRMIAGAGNSGNHENYKE